MCNIIWQYCLTVQCDVNGMISYVAIHIHVCLCNKWTLRMIMKAKNGFGKHVWNTPFYSCSHYHRVQNMKWNQACGHQVEIYANRLMEISTLINGWCCKSLKLRLIIYCLTVCQTCWMLPVVTGTWVLSSFPDICIWLEESIIF
jgi:hypothetical protein